MIDKKSNENTHDISQYSHEGSKEQNQVSNPFSQSDMEKKDNKKQNSYFTDFYSTGSDAHKYMLKTKGLSSVESYKFRSPWLIDPHMYGPKTIIKPPGFREKKIIACYNCPDRFFITNKHNNNFKQCPFSECELSMKSGFNKSADMMLFWQHVGIHHPPTKPKDQLWMFVSWEAPPHRGYPSHHFMDLFNYTMTYIHDDDFFLPYTTLAYRDPALLKDEHYYVKKAKSKTRNVMWMVSHCHSKSQRDEYVKEMQKYIDVDVFGKCTNRTCPKYYNQECFVNLEKNYRFYLSFENSFCTDYVTEKFFKLFKFSDFNVIPVVRGGFDYDKYIPRGTFINTANFPKAKDLALKLLELSKDPYALGKYYKEKDKFVTTGKRMDWCDFCEKLHNGGFKKQVIHDVREYAFSKNACFPPPDDIV